MRRPSSPAPISPSTAASTCPKRRRQSSDKARSGASRVWLFFVAHRPYLQRPAGGTITTPPPRMTMPDTHTPLFPPIVPSRHGMLAVDALHTIYWEEVGNPAGVPVIFLHGGPGAGVSPQHRRFFDPQHYRVILFDQRGAGKSTPLGECRDNTTQLLIADIETLRELFGVERWLVFGGSWGSTLALAYGEVHPERCLGFVLRGIFLCRQSEIEWFLYGLKNIFPEAWQKFAATLPANERADLLDAYCKRLMDPDPDVHLPAARAWGVYEGSCSTLLPSPDTVAHFASDVVALGLARMEAH